MTIEEAIEKLTDEKETIIKARAVYKLPDYGFPDEQYDIAIEALEKQIAKKPLKITMEYDGDYGYCPSCNEILADYSDTRVCKSCGQKIDWGKE